MGSRFLRTQRRPFPASSLWIVWLSAASVGAIPATFFGDTFDPMQALMDFPQSLLQRIDLPGESASLFAGFPNRREQTVQRFPDRS